MSGVLALDLSTFVGFAVGDTDDATPTALEVASGVQAPPFLSGMYQIGRPKCPIGQFFDIFARWLVDLITVHNPTVLVFEEPWIGPKTHQDTARKLMGLACVTEMIAFQKGIRKVWEVNNSTVRKHFIGSGRGQRAELKAKTIAACRARGWQPVDDNAADALAVLDYSIHCLRRVA